MSVLGLYLLLGVCTVSVSAASHFCYTCRDVQNTDHCTHTEKCHMGESCGSELTLQNGAYQLHLGCFSHHTCDHEQDIIGRRDNSGLICRKCCHGDRCNKHLCTGGLPSQTTVLPGPGQGTGTCMDHEEDGLSCTLYGKDMCLSNDPNHYTYKLAHSKCPKYCGICSVHAGHVHPTQPIHVAPTQAGHVHPTQPIHVAPTQDTAQQQCYSCHDVSDPTSCHMSHSCHDDQKCGTEVHVSPEGNVAFHLGCLRSHECDQPLDPMGGHEIHRRQPGHNTLCRQCCDTVNCNKQLCASYMPSHQTTDAHTDAHTDAVTSPTPIVPINPMVTATSARTSTTMVQPITTTAGVAKSTGAGSTDAAPGSGTGSQGAGSTDAAPGIGTGSQGAGSTDAAPGIGTGVSGQPCLDDEMNGFSCAQFDEYNFCTDQTSFAYALATTRCPKHCGFCQ